LELRIDAGSEKIFKFLCAQHANDMPWATGDVRLISLSPNQPFCEINRARQNYLQNSRN
jgi:hypothetical protein